MTIGRTRTSILAAGLLVWLLPATSAHAQLGKAEINSNSADSNGRHSSNSRGRGSVAQTPDDRARRQS